MQLREKLNCSTKKQKNSIYNKGNRQYIRSVLIIRSSIQDKKKVGKSRHTVNKVPRNNYVNIVDHLKLDTYPIIFSKYLERGVCY